MENDCIHRSKKLQSLELYQKQKESIYFKDSIYLIFLWDLKVKTSVNQFRSFFSPNKRTPRQSVLISGSKLTDDSITRSN